ncbi:hypothetical protein [Flavimarina sp. Hel_I_48]|uniref:hypothetical protein n=1 Tax=Flavimarina sp. Hel_I_48 TaxID=1392488 RepID=UPI0004DF3A67|nr:hypothetical protein [Flavimarina sp. Hel_I_48]
MKELSEFTDEELLAEAKKMKSSAVTNALFIGFLIGILIYGTVKNSLGLLALLPLFLIYKLIKGSKKNKPLEEELKARNLKV